MANSLHRIPSNLLIDYRLRRACRLLLFSRRLCYRNTVMLHHIYLFTGSLLFILSTAFCTFYQGSLLS